MKEGSFRHEAFCDRVHNRRTELRLGTVELSMAAGLHGQRLWRILSGGKPPTPDEIVRLATVLQVSCDWLLTGHTPAPVAATA